jgi:hypothetical protein
VVAFLQNLNKDGHVLLIQGLDAAGTQAAADMLFGDDEMQKVVQANVQRPSVAGGFELLIEVNSLDANSHPTGTRIVSIRSF